MFKKHYEIANSNMDIFIFLQQFQRLRPESLAATDKVIIPIFKMQILVTLPGLVKNGCMPKKEKENNDEHAVDTYSLYHQFKVKWRYVSFLSAFWLYTQEECC